MRKYFQSVSNRQRCVLVVCKKRDNQPRKTRVYVSAKFEAPKLDFTVVLNDIIVCPYCE